MNFFKKANNFTLPLLCLTLLMVGEVSAEPQLKVYRVKEALTGDTVLLTTGSKLQYSSIIAPELNGVTADVREMARESLEFNRNLIEGQEITVEWGYKLRSDRGNYQAFVFLADGRMVNEIILDEGYAKLHIEPPNLKYADRLRKAGGFSRAQGRGLWRHEEGRKEHTIYIGDKMTKKFHFRGCEDLDGKSQAHLKEFPARIKALSDGYQFCSVCRDRYSEETDIF